MLCYSSISSILILLENQAVLRIRDVYAGSRVKKIPDPYKRIQVFLTKKIVSKLSEIGSGIFIPGSQTQILILIFYPSRIPEPDPQH